MTAGRVGAPPGRVREGAQGPSAPPPVVLLHGFTGSSGSWDPALVSGLAGSGRTVRAVDLPGHGAHGAEPTPEGSMLERALEIVGGAASGPLDLVAYSMGGRIALHFAERFPHRVRRLVLESASPGLRTEEERARRRASDEALATGIERDGVTTFVDAWERRPLLAGTDARSAEARARARRIRLGNSAEGLARALRGLGTGALPSLWDRLPDLGVPTLLLVGAEDAKFLGVARRMSELMPQARVEVVSGAGHSVHLDRPDRWLQAVRGHLGGE